MIIPDGIVSEIADNWPAFLYIAMTSGFSILFLRERRTETRVLRYRARRLDERIQKRFVALERLIRASVSLRGRQTGRALQVPRHRKPRGQYARR